MFWQEFVESGWDSAPLRCVGVDVVSETPVKSHIHTAGVHQNIACPGMAADGIGMIPCQEKG